MKEKTKASIDEWVEKIRETNEELGMPLNNADKLYILLMGIYHIGVEVGKTEKKEGIIEKILSAGIDSSAEGYALNKVKEIAEGLDGNFYRKNIQLCNALENPKTSSPIHPLYKEQ